MTDLPATYRKIVLASRPTGMPTDDNLHLVETPMVEPGPDQILTRTIYMSLDPYMRGRMNVSRSYAANVELGDTMVGGTVGQVVKSNYAGLEPGDFVLTSDGWQEYGVSDGKHARKLDPSAAPISLALSVLGMPGMTAYVGLLDFGRPEPGETVVVSAASGAVGSVVGQIAKVKGARAVGIAGGPDKCAYVKNELGFDDCVDYKADDFKERLKAACPNEINVYFENVGGKVFEVVLDQLADFARIPLCGRIANYNDSEAPPGPNLLPKTMGIFLTRRVSLRGFIVSNHADRAGAFHRDMAQWLGEGRIKYREDITEGIETARDAFRGLLTGKNFGKQLVRLSPDPTR